MERQDLSVAKGALLIRDIRVFILFRVMMRGGGGGGDVIAR